MTFQAKTSTQAFSPGKIPGFPGIFPGDNSPGSHREKITSENSPGITGTHREILPGFTGMLTGIYRDTYRDSPGWLSGFPGILVGIHRGLFVMVRQSKEL